MKKLLLSALLFLMAGALSAQNPTSVWGTNGCDTVPSTKHLGRVFVGLKTNNFAPASTNLFFGWNGTTYGWFVPAGGGGGGTPGGADGNIQINKGGAFYGTNALNYVAFGATGAVVTNAMGGSYAVMAPAICFGSTNSPEATIDIQFRMGANGRSRWDDSGGIHAGVIDTEGNTSGSILQKWYRRTDSIGVEFIYNGNTDQKFFIANRNADLNLGAKSTNSVNIGTGFGSSSNSFTTIVSVDQFGLNGHGNSISNFVGLAGGSQDVVILEDIESQGTDMPSAGSGNWGTRAINTVSQDTGSHVVSLATNSFELATGTYEVQITAMCWAVDRTKLRFRNVTDGTTVHEGASGYVVTGTTCPLPECFIWTNSVAGKKFSVEQFVTTDTSSGRGFGISCGVGQEHYFYATFRKR